MSNIVKVLQLTDLTLWKFKSAQKKKPQKNLNDKLKMATTKGQYLSFKMSS